MATDVNIIGLRFNPEAKLAIVDFEKDGRRYKKGFYGSQAVERFMDAVGQWAPITFIKELPSDCV